MITAIKKKSHRTDHQLVLTRILKAPRELVWKVWTEAEHVKNWWANNGFTLTLNDMDLRPGGFCSFIIRSPDGHEFPNKIDYLEVVPNERLVYKDDEEERVVPVNFHVSVSLEPYGSRTRLTMAMVFKSQQEMEYLEDEFGATDGANDTLAALMTYLNSLQIRAQA